jgi:hypothetical protein
VAISEEIKKWVAESVAGWTTNKFYPRQAHQRTSQGAASKGLPIMLNSSGKIDSSFVDSISMTEEYQIISGGVVTVDHPYMWLDTQAAAASDDLDTINGGVTGQIIVIRIWVTGHTVVIKDSTGNIRCGGAGDRTLDHVDDTWVGIYSSTSWCEIAFSNNS